MSIAKEKRNLREEIKTSVVSNREQKDRIISEHLKALLKDCETLLSYNPIKGEVDVSKINLEFAQKNSLYLPRVEGKELGFYKAVDFNRFTIGCFDIKEPEPIEKLIKTENALCIVPALAYSKKFERLGRGGGYYDRFLKDYKGIKLGVCYSEFLLPKLPTEHFDMSVDIIVSDCGVFRKDKSGLSLESPPLVRRS